MFDVLTAKLEAVLHGLRGKGRLSEGDVAAACRELRLALLEADVNFKVARDFVNRIKDKAVGQEVLESLSPGQQVVRIVRDELAELLGGESAALDLDGDPSTSSPLRQGYAGPAGQAPAVVLMVGLQGGGKTTTCGKLALFLKGSGKRPLLVATDLKRAAAVEQLRVVGEQVKAPVFVCPAREGSGDEPVAIVQAAVSHARSAGLSPVIVDTAGRTHADEELMAELVVMKEKTAPREVLLVLDAMTGQDAVNVAEQFHQRVGITGVVLTKLDGDARGGAALSVRAVTGRPIKLVGVGEKLDALEVFHPERMATRILGMGDVLTLIERAEAAYEEREAEELEKELRRRQFNLEDFLRELQRMSKMGPLEHLLGMIPGMQALRGRMPLEIDPKRVKRMVAIVQSMTPRERQEPDVIDGSRRRRVARGSGVSRQEVNLLLKQFREMRAVIGQLMAAEQSGRPFRGMGVPRLGG